MSKAQEIIDLMHYTEGLKKELRVFTLSDGARKESTAEHSWRLALLVMLVGPELKMKVDVDKAIKIALAHDVVEVEAGDVPYMQHFENQDLKNLKEKSEKEAMERIKEKFGESGSIIDNLWLEYEEQKTPESKLVKALDKIEGRLQYILDPVITFDEKETDKVPGVIRKTTELCSIDPFLADLDVKTVHRRGIKAKIEKDSFKK